MNVKRKIFEFLVDHHYRCNYLPTLEETRKMFEELTDDVNLHIEQLVREGLVRLAPDDRGTVEIVSTYKKVPEFNFRTGSTSTSQTKIALDLSAAGIPMEPNLYTMSVFDDSMIDGGLQRGDIAIISSALPQRGDIVVVEIDGKVALRRYIEIRGIPHVLAENPMHPQLDYAFDLPFNGVVWGSIRKGISTRVFSTIAPTEVYCPPPPRRGEKKKRSPGRATGHEITRNRNSLQLTATSYDLTPSSTWPKPPSGVELNDLPCPEQSYGGKIPKDQHKGYGWVMAEALKRYEENEARRLKRAAAKKT